MKLDPNFKEQWIAALRSGAYRQAKKCLVTDEGYCCLGVACTVLGIGITQMMSRAFPEPLDLHRMKLTFNTALHLARMNDEQDKPFAEIADYIQDNL